MVNIFPNPYVISFTISLVKMYFSRIIGYSDFLVAINIHIPLYLGHSKPKVYHSCVQKYDTIFK